MKRKKRRSLSKAIIYLLERRIPIFAIPRKPFSQASIGGNNSILSVNQIVKSVVSCF